MLCAETAKEKDPIVRGGKGGEEGVMIKRVKGKAFTP